MSRLRRRRAGATGGAPLDPTIEALAAGVAETVALSRARGQAVLGPETARGPYRRQSGLGWLAGKGRINAANWAAGERYGQTWRRARMEGAIRSSLDVRPGGGSLGGPSLRETLTHAEGTAYARQVLARMRGRLSHQPDLVAACDQVCGQELTPREAAGGDREALRLEALLKVALDLLVGG